MPPWCRVGFETYREATLHVLELLLVVQDALARAPQALALAVAVDNLRLATAKPIEEPAVESREARLVRERHLANVAQKEAESGYSSVTALWTIAVWGYLEAHVEDILATWMKHRQSALQVQVVREVKIPLADYLSASDDERFAILVQEVERKQGAGAQQGIGRFAPLLDALELSAAVPPDVRRDMFEFHNVRNSLAHRRGVADRRLVTACPWLGLSVGDPVRVSLEQLAQYIMASATYMTGIANRMEVLLSA